MAKQMAPSSILDVATFNVAKRVINVRQIRCNSHMHGRSGQNFTECIELNCITVNENSIAAECAADVVAIATRR